MKQDLKSHIISFNTGAQVKKLRHQWIILPQNMIPVIVCHFFKQYFTNQFTTDRWEISHLKIANAIKVRELLELFYGVPSIWSLDLDEIEKHQFHLKKLYQFFSPLHKVIVTEELKDFIWLDKERKVQQILFGKKAKLTANFSDTYFENIPGDSLEVHWLEEDKKEYYTP